MSERNYYRCVDCLSVAAVDGPAVFRSECGYCGGKCEHMGRVRAERLIKTGLGCPCDGRCTGARGPKCDCHCGGVNHGSGMLVPIVIDCGPVPIIKIQPTATAARVAAEWRAAWGELAAARAELDARKAAGEFLSYDDYNNRARFAYAATAARRSRSHSGRLATIRKVLPEVATAATAGQLF